MKCSTVVHFATTGIGSFFPFGAALSGSLVVLEIHADLITFLAFGSHCSRTRKAIIIFGYLST